MLYRGTIFIALSLAVASTGCTRHHKVSARQLSAIASTGGEVRLIPGTPIDPAHWHDGDVQSVTQTSHGRGAVHGFGIGALSGAGLGVVMGLASGDDSCGDYDLICFSAGEKATMGGLLFGGMGAVAGLVIGAIAGSDTVYELDPNAQRVRLNVSPRGEVGVAFDF